jgi:hypothetical protein
MSPICETQISTRLAYVGTNEVALFRKISCYYILEKVIIPMYKMLGKKKNPMYTRARLLIY